MWLGAEIILNGGFLNAQFSLQHQAAAVEAIWQVCFETLR